ncbi:hypothetical protein [Streptomyces lunalinharesii]|uniref:Uncharacterized protein n=1 Tax=Streptomyces lunalinharesii TaxID=333384 RepID=A0ABP6ELK2_9ACTN
MAAAVAVPLDVIMDDDLVIGGGAVAPVQDLVEGQVLEELLLVVVTSANSGSWAGAAAGRAAERP